MSDTPTSLVNKLAEVMAVVERIPKRGRNNFHQYDYATEADIAATVRKELAARHVMLIPAITNETRHPVGEKGSVLTVLEMEMEFLDGDTQESIKKPWRGYGTDKEDKGGYKAMTGGEKYFLLKTFLMPTGDDPEQDEKETKGYAVTAPAVTPAPPPARPTASDPSDPNGGGSGHYTPPEPRPHVDLPEGAVLIRKVDGPAGKAKGFVHPHTTRPGANGLAVYDEALVDLAAQCCQEQIPVRLITKVSQSGREYLTGLVRVASEVEIEGPPLTAEEIPF